MVSPSLNWGPSIRGRRRYTAGMQQVYMSCKINKIKYEYRATLAQHTVLTTFSRHTAFAKFYNDLDNYIFPLLWSHNSIMLYHWSYCYMQLVCSNTHNGYVMLLYIIIAILNCWNGANVKFGTPGRFTYMWQIWHFLWPILWRCHYTTLGTILNSGTVPYCKGNAIFFVYINGIGLLLVVLFRYTQPWLVDSSGLPAGLFFLFLPPAHVFSLYVFFHAYNHECRWQPLHSLIKTVLCTVLFKARSLTKPTKKLGLHIRHILTLLLLLSLWEAWSYFSALFSSSFCL